MNKLEQAARRLIDLTAEICEYSYSDEIEQAYADAREALAEQAEQEPMYISESCAERGCACHYSVEVDGEPVAVYSAPVRTKDLTDDEIAEAVGSPLDEVYLADFRAVIAAYKAKNNGVD